MTMMTITDMRGMGTAPPVTVMAHQRRSRSQTMATAATVVGMAVTPTAVAAAPARS